MTAPGAEIDEGHRARAGRRRGHEQVFGAPPERDVTRWFTDASALSRYGIPTVNYGTSTGLMDVELGENLDDRRARADGARSTRSSRSGSAASRDGRRLHAAAGPARAGGRRRRRLTCVGLELPDLDARVFGRPGERAGPRRDLRLPALRAGPGGRCCRAGTRRRAHVGARRSRARSATRTTSSRSSACASRGSPSQDARRTSASSPSGIACRFR